MDQEKIGKFIAKLRKEKNMTQQDLADKLGITKNAVSKWERGISLMDISLLKPLSEIFEINISELLNGEEISKINNEIINNTFVEGTKIYMNKEKRKLLLKILGIIVIAFIILFTSLTIISEYNYGIIPLGESAYIEFSNISSRIGKKNADKYMKHLIKKDYNFLDNFVVENNNYLIKGHSENKEWLELEEKIHSKSYSENLKEFYNKVDIINYKYDYFYYNGYNYVYSYSMLIKYKNKDYNIKVELIPHQQIVKLDGWGQISNNKNDVIQQNDELFNILHSIFGW